MKVQSAARACQGFTLIELMTVTVIVTVLLSLAIASYQNQMRQSRRVEAKTALLDLATREERFLSTNPQGYTTAANSLGYAAFPAQVGSNYYTITVGCIAGVGAALACDPNPNAPAGLAYYLTATPVAGTSQANDTQCQSFAVDSTGAQFAFNAAGANNTAYCWSN
jgi:type IV pilus assembly protein PilE